MVTSAFLVLLVAMAINRLLVGRSVRSLTVEQKAMLVDMSASRRPWFFVLVIVLVVAWVVICNTVGYRDWLFIPLLLLLMILSIAAVFLRLRRLAASGLPQEYIRSVWIGGVLLMLGMSSVIAAMIYSTLTFVPT